MILYDMAMEDTKVIMIVTMISLARLFQNYFDAKDQIGMDPSMNLRSDKQDEAGNIVV
jgi:hypothetical protein